MSITIKCYISRSTSGARITQRHSAWLKSWFLSVVHFLSQSLGVSVTYLSWVAAPPQVTGPPCLSPLYISSKQAGTTWLGARTTGDASDKHLVFITRGSRGEQGCCSVWWSFTTIRTSLKERVQHPVIASLPTEGAERSADMISGLKMLCICCTHLFTPEGGGPACWNTASALPSCRGSACLFRWEGSARDSRQIVP